MFGAGPCQSSRSGSRLGAISLCPSIVQLRQLIVVLDTCPHGLGFTADTLKLEGLRDLSRATKQSQHLNPVLLGLQSGCCPSACLPPCRELRWHGVANLALTHQCGTQPLSPPGEPAVPRHGQSEGRGSLLTVLSFYPGSRGWGLTVGNSYSKREVIDQKAGETQSPHCPVCAWVLTKSFLAQGAMCNLKCLSLFAGPGRPSGLISVKLKYPLK